jgi:thiamine transporter ThiT
MHTRFSKESKMNLLLTIGLILAVLWLLGLISSYTLGGGIHILLVIAIILVIAWLINGRR